MASSSWRQREFNPNDLNGVALVVAAVPREIARAVYEEAQIRNVLVNSVDDPDNCDFYYPAVVNRGDLQIAISTAGHSPALAQRIRIELEQQFGPGYEAWIRRLGEARRELFASDMNPDERKRKLHEMAGAAPGQQGPAGRIQQDAPYVLSGWCTSLAPGLAIPSCSR